MEIFISCICSVVISIVIGNIVGIHYLSKLNNEWELLFKKMEEVMIGKIKEHMHR